MSSHIPILATCTCAFVISFCAQLKFHVDEGDTVELQEAVLASRAGGQRLSLQCPVSRHESLKQLRGLKHKSTQQSETAGCIHGSKPL